jgi:SlyX protein
VIGVQNTRLITAERKARWQQIVALTRQVAALRESLREAEGNATGPVNEPPPHY